MSLLPIANSDGATYRAAVNVFLASLATQQAGNSRPADAGAGTIWVDKNTPSATVWSVFAYDGSADTLLGLWDTTADTFAPANAMPLTAMKGWISGLTYSNNGSDPTNDIDIAAGSCMDATSAKQITLAALTKRLDAAWAVGTNQGGLDTGSIGNSDYYIWAILRSDTGVTDILFSLSSTAPTMPANYDYKRLIGWFKRVSAAIVAFKTYETAGGGIDFRWTTPTLDVDLSNTLTTSRRTDAVKVPLNFSTEALLRILMFDASSAFAAIVCCPDETDAAPSSSATPLQDINAAAGNVAPSTRLVRTSSTGTVAARAGLATVDNYRVLTLGFVWSRR
jgi:hypothetical protein